MLDAQIWQEKAKTYEKNELEIRENNGKSYSNFEKVTTCTISGIRVNFPRPFQLPLPLFFEDPKFFDLDIFWKDA